MLSSHRRSSSGLSKPTIGILRRQLEQIEEEFAVSADRRSHDWFAKIPSRALR